MTGDVLPFGPPCHGCHRRGVRLGWTLRLPDRSERAYCRRRACRLARTAWLAGSLAWVDGSTAGGLP